MPGSARFFLWAVIFSTLIHAGLGWKFLDRPVGTIDRNLIRQDRGLIRVKRASWDRVVTTTSLTQQPDAPPTTAQLSQALLEANAAPSPTSISSLAAAAQPPPRFRKVTDRRRDTAPSKGAVDMPKAELPSRLLEAAAESPSASGLTLQPSFLEPSGGAGGTDALRAAGDDQFQRMLGGAPAYALTQPPPLKLDRPELLEPPVRDQRTIQPSAAVPTVDVADAVLQNTLQYDLPEHLDNDFIYRVSTFKPPPQRKGFFQFGSDATDDPRGYLQIDIEAKRSLRKLRTLPKDMIFLIDTSGSVPQPWVDQVRRGVLDALNSLNPDDRFNIVVFNENPRFLKADGPLTLDDTSRTAAEQFLGRAQSAGYTDVNRVLSRLLTRDVSAQRVYNLILISDGRPTRGVQDTRELINLITRDNDLVASIYCVGIGANQNRQVLDFLAYRNKGFSTFVDSVDQAANAIRVLASRLRYPVIKDVQLTVMGLDAEEVYPRNLPDIYQGQALSLYGRYDQPGAFTMQLTGINGQQPVDFAFTRHIQRDVNGLPQIAQDWAFWKLHHLYSQILRHGQTKELQAEVEQLRKQYGLKTLY